MNDCVGILEAIAECAPLMLDGATGSMLIASGACEGMCCDVLSLTRPDMVASLHRQYIEAGADLLRTNTFNASPLTGPAMLGGHSFKEINRAAVRLARHEADAAMLRGRRVFVVGTMGPSAVMLSQLTGRELALRALDVTMACCVQADMLISEGVDMMLLESVYDADTAKAALRGIRCALSAHTSSPVPLAVSVALYGDTGRLYSGQTPMQFYDEVSSDRIDIIGLNCSDGVGALASSLPSLISDGRPVMFYPSAGLPDSRGVYNISADEFATAMWGTLSQYPVAMAGGCCGTTPEYIGKLSTLLKT
ncbi:MAG: homocysteine S-methyltransferase family protein [Bacteroides sp.]|nr:homocysteine S-methyltransferase family protein [Bacteroides sp.]MCM1413958.1 homocysteine S-methyltransferase family protein [Bacteroides sp.]MCM1471825.1 homocysteine S-methyltransferase family protein [Bacteroides sp.]